MALRLALSYLHRSDSMSCRSSVGRLEMEILVAFNALFVRFSGRHSVLNRWHSLSKVLCKEVSNSGREEPSPWAMVTGAESVKQIVFFVRRTHRRNGEGRLYPTFLNHSVSLTQNETQEPWYWASAILVKARHIGHQNSQEAMRARKLVQCDVADGEIERFPRPEAGHRGFIVHRSQCPQLMVALGAKRDAWIDVICARLVAAVPSSDDQRHGSGYRDLDPRKVPEIWSLVVTRRTPWSHSNRNSVHFA